MKWDKLIAGVIVFLVYILLVTFVSGFNKTFPLIFKYTSTLNWFKLATSLALTLCIGALVAINTITFYSKSKERKQCKKEYTLATAGTVGSLAVGVCPICVTGIFPLLFSLFGVTFSFASLPLQGIEIQFLMFIILLISLLMLRKK